jgi:hypothetical protein
MTEAQIITKIQALREVIPQLVEHLYPGILNDQIIELNQQLRSLTDKNFSDYSDEEIHDCIAETYVLTNK